MCNELVGVLRCTCSLAMEAAASSNCFVYFCTVVATRSHCGSIGSSLQKVAAAPATYSVVDSNKLREVG